MKATDVAPSRVAAARDAAHRFLELVPDGMPVGLVAFNENARAVVAPTTDHDGVGLAIDRLQLGPGTAIGEALYTALDMLPQAETADGAASRGARARPTRRPRRRPAAPSCCSPTAIPPSGARRTTPPAGRPSWACRSARSPSARRTARSPSASRPCRVPVDAAALRRVAETTGGRAFEAATADELRSVFEDLGEGVGVERVEREVTDLFIGAALAFAVAAAVGSLAWFSRLP